MPQTVTATASARWEDRYVAAKAFSKRWAGETRERGEKDTFWNDFLSSIFDIDRRQVGQSPVLNEVLAEQLRGDGTCLVIFAVGVVVLVASVVAAVLVVAILAASLFVRSIVCLGVGGRIDLRCMVYVRGVDLRDPRVFGCWLDCDFAGRLAVRLLGGGHSATLAG